MKRTLPLLFIMTFQLLVSSLVLFQYQGISAVIGLFLLNLLLFGMLAAEPYWKIGAWILFCVFSEMMAYILNLVAFGFFLKIHAYLNMFVLLLGVIVVGIAHWMTINEGLDKIKRSKVAKKIEAETHDEEAAEPKPMAGKLFLYKGEIHTEACESLKDAADSEKSIIGNRLYAKSKYKGCGICSPFK